MDINEKMVQAGDLEKEIKEIDKIFLNEESVIMPASATTELCGAFLTLLCC